MKWFLFFLFFLSFELVSAGFGVSPNKIVNEGEVYVINSDNYENEYSLKASEGVVVSDELIRVGVKEKKKVYVKAIKSGILEVIEKNGKLSSSVIIKVESTKPNVEFYSSAKKKNGVIGVIAINLVGVGLVGVLQWKKKLF